MSASYNLPHIREGGEGGKAKGIFRKDGIIYQEVKVK